MNLQSVKTAAVVLNWNQSSMTLDCVQALRKQTRSIDLLIVVDNGSKPEQRAILDGLDNGVRRIQLQANRGFAGGMNAGIRAALESGVSYVWLMNNDAFPEPDCLAALVSAMETDATLGAVTPRIVRSDGSEEHAGGRYDFTTDSNTIFAALEFSKPDTDTGYWVNGPAPLVRAKALAAAGLFDERIFAYWEEIELCFRVAKCGFWFRAVPEVFVTHLGSVSTGGVVSAGAVDARAIVHACPFQFRSSPLPAILGPLMRGAPGNCGAKLGVISVRTP